jgi:RNA-binding protein 39
VFHVEQHVRSGDVSHAFLDLTRLIVFFFFRRESNQNWDVEIRDDVIEECNKHGGVLHVYVDKGSPQGNVYVKCPSIATAVASVNSLHGRWFAGRVITAAYVPLLNYHSLFPDAMTAAQLLLPSNRK